MAESKSNSGHVVDRTETIYEGEIWGMENVYIFPGDMKRDVRGILWVIPPTSTAAIEYADDPGFVGQHYAYDLIKQSIQEGHIPQDEWVIVVAANHRWSLEQCSSNAKDVFREQGLSYAKHIDLCGCCTTPDGKQYLNAVYAIGEGANAIDFGDPELTNVIMSDPILYPPMKIPEDIASNITLAMNPNNYDPTTPSGEATLNAFEELKEILPPDNIVESNQDAFNTAAIAAGILALVNFAADLIDMFGPQGGDLEDTPGPLDEDLEEIGVMDDPAGTPESKQKDQGTPTPSPVAACADYQSPQVIITSDRLVFNARQDAILMSAGTYIGISATEAVGIDVGGSGHFTVNAPEIHLGLDSVEPLILGQQMHDWCVELIDKIQMLTYTNSGGPTGPAINAAILDTLKTDFVWDYIKSDQNYTL